MDDLEFRRQAFANPRNQDPDFLAAAQTSPERAQLLQQLLALDDRVGAAARSIAIPSGLASRLRALQDSAANDSAAADSPKTRRYIALAASLVVAIGLILSPGLMTAQPSASDLKFHDEVIVHVYREVARYDTKREDASIAQISSVLVEAGGHLRDAERIKQMHIKFANGCNIAANSKGAHIVLDGEKGSVSVMVVHNSPVTTTFNVNDSRFAGKIIPFGEGNLIIVGEKDEPLAKYEAMIADSFEWSI